jgi:hypothetical protein
MKSIGGHAITPLYYYSLGICARREKFFGRRYGDATQRFQEVAQAPNFRRFGFFSESLVAARPRCDLAGGVAVCLSWVK